ncbi:MAG: TetR family transcriptional regulator [Betaproteobacteria bacterium]|nr:TetR family transcriptional regulator [Betaproteobacteria bacterium]
MPALRRTQTERSGETRQQLLKATVGLIMERGLAGATLTDICRRAGVTTGALQHQFGAKNELMAATVAALFAPFAEAFPSSDRPADIPLRTRIERLVDRYAKIYADPRYPAVIEILSATRHDAGLEAAVSKHRDVQVENLAKHLATEFPDVMLPLDRMLESAHQVVDLMRGGTIRMMFERSREAGEANRWRACQILHAEFSAAQDTNGERQ